MQLTHRLILYNIAANKLFNKRIILKGVLKKQINRNYHLIQKYIFFVRE